MSNIRLSQEELRFIQILEGLTGVMPVDCIFNKEERRIIFVVRQNDTGKVIGSGGTTVRRLREHFRKHVEVVEYSEKIDVFASNTLAPAKTQYIDVLEDNGIKTVIIEVTPIEKGKAIGKNGKNIARSRLLMKRHFGVKNVQIQTAN